MFHFESAALSNFALSACGLGQHVFTVVAGNHRLSMTEDHVNFIAASAANVHKVGVGGGDQSLELVGLPLLFLGGAKQISVHGNKYKYYNIHYYYFEKNQFSWVRAHSQCSGTYPIRNGWGGRSMAARSPFPQYSPLYHKNPQGRLRTKGSLSVHSLRPNALNASLGVAGWSALQNLCLWSLCL